MKWNKLIFLPILFSFTLTGCGDFFRLTNPYSKEEENDIHYFRSKELSLKNAFSHTSEVDHLFNYLAGTTSSEVEQGQQKFGEKFFLVFVQEDCVMCDEYSKAFHILENQWGKGEFSELKDQTPYRLHTIYVDTINDYDSVYFFETVYSRQIVSDMMMDAVGYMMDAVSVHPYFNNVDSYNYETKTHSLDGFNELETPTTFLIDFTDDGHRPWTSPCGIREILFDIPMIGSKDALGRARILRDAWTDVDRSDNIFSPLSLN